MSTALSRRQQGGLFLLEKTQWGHFRSSSNPPLPPNDFQPILLLGSQPSCKSLAAHYNEDECYAPVANFP